MKLLPKILGYIFSWNHMALSVCNKQYCYSQTSLSLKKLFNAQTIRLYVLGVAAIRIENKKHQHFTSASQYCCSLQCAVDCQPQEYSWVFHFLTLDWPISSHFPLRYEWYLSNVYFNCWLNTTSLTLVTTGIARVLSVHKMEYLLTAFFWSVRISERWVSGEGILSVEHALPFLPWECQQNSRVCILCLQEQQPALWGFEI